MGGAAGAELSPADPGDGGSLADGGRLFSAAAQFPLAGRRTIALPARPPPCAKLRRVLALRFGAVEIGRPCGELARLPATVSLRLVEVQEIALPAGAEPLYWRPLTTHRIADATEAWRIVDWYQARWTIEHCSG